MRLVDYLVQILEAHAKTLQRLAAFFGEEGLLAILESSELEEPPPIVSKLDPLWVAPPGPTSRARATYALLEGAVHEINLPAVLEFHLWAYPYYRHYIESAIDLESRFADSSPESAHALVEEAVVQAEQWMRGLKIPRQLEAAAQSAAKQPWIRFRTHALKSIGHRPLGAV